MFLAANILVFVSFSLLFIWVASRVTKYLRPEDLDLANESIRKPALYGTLTRPLANLLPSTKSKRAELQKALIAAGQFEYHALENFLAGRNLLMMVAVTGSATAFASGLADGWESLAATVTLVTCVLVYSVPSLVISARSNRRTRKIEKNLPDALDLLALSIGSGVPMNRSFEMITSQLRHSHPALSLEFQIIEKQSRSGSVELAFESFAKRIQLPESHWLVFADPSKPASGW